MKSVHQAVCSCASEQAARVPNTTIHVDIFLRTVHVGHIPYPPTPIRLRGLMLSSALFRRQQCFALKQKQPIFLLYVVDNY